MMRAELGVRGFASALVVTGLVALATVAPASAQTKGGAKPAATAKPWAAGTAKADAKGAKAAPKASKPACDLEPKPKLADAKKKDEAKNAFKEGNKRFEASDYENALICFKLADAYVPGGKPKFKVASSLDKLGKVAEAVAAYRTFLKVVAPTPDAKIEDKFQADATAAKARVEVLEKTPNKITVIVSPAEVVKARVDLDGARQTSTELSVPPGKHTITVTADGYETSKVALDLGFAETRDVTIALIKKPWPVENAGGPAATNSGTPAGGAPTTTASAVASAAPRPPENKGKILMGVGGVFFAITAARVVAGAVYGGMAISNKAEFDAMVAGPHDPAVATAKADETHANARLADFSFATAIPGAVVATVLVIVGATRSGSSSTKTGQTSQEKTAAALRRGFIAPVATPEGGGATVQFTF